MNIQEIRNLLEQQAERLLELASKLGEGGRRLKPHELELIRSAVYSRLNEHLSYLKMLFLDGRDLDDWGKGELERIFEIVR